ncbi:hypothetical protein K4S71_02195 [Staphylococcus epidermidis]|nr:hypothetical protein [Staphylococcus epidermidis]MCG1262249.1 hypothetical protein [Staphylococcus epidermidis]MCG1302915.1 hypothetical protein [Staphylococcus epidermidis]MCG1502065.1 hypothetical protein [Staphylococcus epidermidis]MCG1590060.1 hypothetical protein [Staphylococcus epidermidis]
MLSLSKGIESGDWLTFVGTLLGALIGALIAGGIAIYVAHLQNKHQKKYIENQNELDKNVKRYDMLFHLINDLVKELNYKFEVISSSTFKYANTSDELELNNLRTQLISNMHNLYNFTLNYTDAIEYNIEINEAIKEILESKNLGKKSLKNSKENFLKQLNELIKLYENSPNVLMSYNERKELIEKANVLSKAKVSLVSMLYGSLSGQLRHIYI